MKTTGKMTYRAFRVGFMALLLMAWAGIFIQSAQMVSDDVTPPYLVDPIPEPGSVTSNWFVIRTGVIDDESGVNPDPDTVTVTINGSPPRVKPIIEPSFGTKRGIKITLILTEEESRSETISVDVQAEDMAPEPNVMQSGWTFFVETITQDPSPVITYPEKHRWLEYDSESGSLVYSWIAVNASPFYRMRFSFQDGSSGTMDIGPYPLSESYHSKSISIDLTSDQWSAVSDAGEIAVEIGSISDRNGPVIGNYSSPVFVTYVLDDLPSLVRPYHAGLLHASIPPVFEWTPVDSPPEHYVVVYVRLDQNGIFTNDVKVFEVPVFIKALPMDISLWNQFDPGVWAWTVVARYPGNMFSNFMIYRFLKY